MITSTRRNTLFATAALAALALAPESAQAQAEIRLGMVVPLTGRYADQGIGFHRAAEFVVNEYNAGGGVKTMGGAKIKLIAADNASEPPKASLEARRLITQEKVSFILGPYSTPEAEAMIPVLDRYEIGALGLFTTLIPTTPFFNIMSLAAPEVGASYGEVFKWAKGKGAKIDTVVVTYANNDYGQTVQKNAVAAIEKLGIKVLEAIPSETAIKDFTPIVLRIKSLNPDAVLSIVYFQDGVLLQKARFNLGYEGPVWFGGIAGFTDDRLWGVVTPEVGQKTLTKALGLSLFSDDAKLPAMQELKKRVKAQKADAVFDQAFVVGAQGTLAALKAIETAKNAEPQAIAKAIRAMRVAKGDPAIVLPIIVGDMYFDDKGVVRQTSPLIVQWHEGAKRIVYPEAIASAPATLK